MAQVVSIQVEAATVKFPSPDWIEKLRRERLAMANSKLLKGDGQSLPHIVSFRLQTRVHTGVAVYPRNFSRNMLLQKYDDLTFGANETNPENRKLDYLLDKNCALVIDLIADVQFVTSGAGADRPPAPAPVVIGWYLLIPPNLTDKELKAFFAQPNQQVRIERDFFQGPGVNIDGSRLTAKIDNTAPKLTIDLQMRDVFAWLQDKRKQTFAQASLKRPIDVSTAVAFSTPKQAAPTLQPAASTAYPSVQQTTSALSQTSVPYQPAFQQTLGGQALAQTSGPALGQVLSQGQVPTSLPALPGMQIERRILRDADTQTEKPAEPVLKEHPPNLLPAVSVARPLDRKDKAAIIAGYGEDQAMKIFEGRVAAAPGIDWRREKEDPLHGAEIALVCMAIRTSSPAARFVKFKVRFFAYPPASTAAVSILRSDVHPVVLKTQHGDAVTLTWRMDGSSYGADSDGAWTLHQQLAEYMSTHDLEIEVWNAESQMQIAVATVPLHHLLRNGAHLKKHEVEAPMRDPMNGAARGALQLLLVNTGKEPEVAKGATARRSAAAAVPGKRARVRAESLRSTAQNQILQQDPETLRKSDRVDRALRMRGEPGTGLEGSRPAQIAAIKSLRQKDRMTEVMNRTRQEHLHEVKVVYPSVGTASFFVIDLINPFEQDTLFEIAVQDETPSGSAPRQDIPPAAEAAAGVLASPPPEELSVLQDAQEWRRLAQAQKLPAPPDNLDDLFGGVPNRLPIILLHAREKVSVPFKYLTFRNVPEGHVGGGPGTVLQLGRSDQETRSHRIMFRQTGRPPVREVEVKARPQASTLSRTLRFYEAEGLQVTKSVRLPPNAGSIPWVYCSDTKVHVKRADDIEVVELSFRVAVSGAAPWTFDLLAYRDRSFHDCAAIFRIQVHGLRAEFLEAELGTVIDRPLALPMESLRGVDRFLVYASDPNLAQISASGLDASGCVHVAGLETQRSHFIMEVTPQAIGKQTCRIHAIDAATFRVIGAWLMVVNGGKPYVKETREVNLPLGTEAEKRLVFRNVIMKDVSYQIRSSNVKRVLVLTPELNMKPLETSFIDLRFPASERRDVAFEDKVFLFIRSADRQSQECHMLHLIYT
jgi:hypothetical protein